MESLSADQLREHLRADRLLADIDLFEDLARLYEEEPKAVARADFAARYRNILGIHPQHRSTFQQGLQAILGGNGKFVQELIRELEPQG